MKYTSPLFQNELTHVSMITWLHDDKKLVRMQEIGGNNMVLLGQKSKIGWLCDKWNIGYVRMQRSHYLMKYGSPQPQFDLTHVSMIIWSHYDKRVVRMRKIGEESIINFCEINKIRGLVDKWSDFGCVRMRRAHYFMKYISPPSQSRLTEVSMIIWSRYDKNIVRLWQNGIIIRVQNSKIGRPRFKWSNFGYVKMQRFHYFMKHISCLS